MSGWRIEDGEKCTSGKNGFAGDFIHYVSNWSALKQRHLSFYLKGSSFISWRKCMARFARFFMTKIGLCRSLCTRCSRVLRRDFIKKASLIDGRKEVNPGRLKSSWPRKRAEGHEQHTFFLGWLKVFPWRMGLPMLPTWENDSVNFAG